jgi:hypothetical protein
VLLTFAFEMFPEAPVIRFHQPNGDYQDYVPEVPRPPGALINVTAEYLWALLKAQQDTIPLNDSRAEYVDA